VLLSARRVGPTGKAYGLDMTDEMLALAQTRTNAKAGLQNVEFLRGEIGETFRCPDQFGRCDHIPTASLIFPPTKIKCYAKSLFEF